MTLFLLCLKIFFVRIIDVSLGTIRTLITVKGRTLLASMVGFVEVFVWFVIVKEALNTNETSLWVAIAYSLGFATGTYIGGMVSNRFIKGNFGVQVVTSNNNHTLIDLLREQGYAVSVIDVKGQDIEQEKYMLFIEIDKNHFSHLKKLIHQIDSKAFIVVNETKYVQNGYIK